MPSRVGHTTTRHPLCPHCRYNLVATIADRKDICPECGEHFEPHELLRSRAAGDWTIWRGLGTGSWVLARRSALAFLVWTAGLWLLLQTAAWLSGSHAVALVLVLLALGFVTVAGGWIGHMTARDMDEHAGMTSFLVIILITIFAWAAIIGGSMVLGALNLLTSQQGYGLCFLGCGFALFMIIRTHLFDIV